ncbi:MAG TPA: hypothetical protein VK530_10785 [Candidatus Acidoferrum sp.]|nr:hypothetical protein [Candidatus Acidoferrum sp.]
MNHSVLMFPVVVDTKDAAAVAREVRAMYGELFPGSDDYFITRAFEWVVGCFEGRCSGYQPIDALYHDLEHTLQGTFALTKLLLGRQVAGAIPAITPKMFELGLLAILLHDTGYLKRTDDTQGTGAKYTLTHVRRSAEFACEFLMARGYAEPEIAAIQNMIRCTGVNVDLTTIPFSSELEKVVGFALGTADLLGQMAADDYIDKLPVLYEEFAEAAKFSGAQWNKAVTFNSAEELMRNTPGFWNHYVWPKVEGDFGKLYRFLGAPDGSNEYLDAINANLARLQQRLALSP